VVAVTPSVPIENIKEIRSGADARYYRQQFQLSRDYEDRWLTIIYVLDGAWKSLHLIAPTKDLFRMWDKTLREQHAIRQELMSGLGNPEMRETLWERHYWKGADEEGDQKLTFGEVEKLCRGLNINSSREDLGRLFTVRDCGRCLSIPQSVNAFIAASGCPESSISRFQ
jgi:phosphatidylinositol phospholipase C delta